MPSEMARPLLIVAHGQPGDPGPQQAAIEALAMRVAALLPEREVLGATLAAPGALKAGLRPGALVYPMFMAGGWFTKVELPRRLVEAGAEGAEILAPFGADPGLVGLALAQIRAVADAAGWRMDEVALLIAAHGSGRSRAPAEAARAFGAALQGQLAEISCGFVEEAPYLVDAARDLVARGLDARAICLPFFATEAGHVTGDLPDAMAEAGCRGRVLLPLGMADEVPAMIAAAVQRASALQI